MLETDSRSKVQNQNALLIARLLLVLEWGLSRDEQEESNRKFWAKVKDQTLDDFYSVLTRLLLKFKGMPEAEARLVTDVILVTMLDRDYSNGEQTMITTLGTMFSFTADDIENFASRANGMLNMLFWFANQNSFEKKISPKT
jgi:hypothetical protein